MSALKVEDEPLLFIRDGPGDQLVCSVQRQLPNGYDALQVITISSRAQNRRPYRQQAECKKRMLCPDAVTTAIPGVRVGSAGSKRVHQTVTLRTAAQLRIASQPIGIGVP
jgi:hypothetical protein